MISYGAAKTILDLPGVPIQTVTRWVVWFQTPFGLCECAEEAAKRCEQNDMPAQLMIKPVAVAIGDDGNYEVAP